MRGVFLKVLYVIVFLGLCNAQLSDFIRNANLEFERGDYTAAVLILKDALKLYPDEPNLYFLLGYYTHYMCYDSRPVSGFNEGKSREILEYLEKAVELNPSLGDAFYFMGSEHGVRFWNAMQRRDKKKMLAEIRKGFEKGGYPEWMLEYARNMLMSCDSNAILFVGGDAEVNSIYYLQLVRSYRKDVSVIPAALLNRPWFAACIKNGIKEILKPVPVSWTDEQIMNMTPYKWKPNKIKIPVHQDALQILKVSSGETMFEWQLEPDLNSPSMTYLSAGKALLVDIIESNQWKRPVHFSISLRGSFVADLESNLQLCGLTYKLLPLNVKERGVALDVHKIEHILLDPDRYIYLADVKRHNMPRVSSMLNNYRGVLLNLAMYYANEGNVSKGLDILDSLAVLVPDSIYPMPVTIKMAIENLRLRLGPGTKTEN